MLSSYCCSMTCLKWLRVLNMPLKESCVVFIIQTHIIVVFSFDALFGLTCCILTPCLTLNLSPKVSMIIWFLPLIPLYALVNNVLSLCMIMAVISLLVGRSQSFASLHLNWEGILLVHPTPKNQSFPVCPPYLPISNLLFQVYSSCFYLSSKLNFFVMRKLVSKALTNLMAHLLSCT
jgi:hypothetical protein